MRLPINSERVLGRFLQYVRIGTSADPNSARYPSSAGQRELGSLLAQQLTAMGADDVVQDRHGIVYATIPATAGITAPTVALIAHLDTSPEAPGDSVQPHVLAYQGGDIVLANGSVISVRETPELSELVGRTLITTDGTTLLGGDDKAGVAIIMELANTLLENPDFPHGPLRIVFTCDEEIGRGTDKIDLGVLNAEVGYTLDGGGAGTIDVETFAADQAVITITGKNIHPSIAKGRMVNAVKAAALLVTKIEEEMPSPERTDGRDGFVHPYEIAGGVGTVVVKTILRSFDEPELEDYAERLQSLADALRGQCEGIQCEIEIVRQYRNLADGLAAEPRAVKLAKQAYRNLGMACRTDIIRGGTDGSLLTEKGLPTPNLSSGQHNIHSPFEFAVLEEMVAGIEHVLELTRLWGAVEGS